MDLVAERKAVAGASHRIFFGEHGQMRFLSWFGIVVLTLFCMNNVGATQPPEETEKPKLKNETEDQSSTTEKEKLYRGRVVDTDGNPIANATVLLNDYGREINSETPPDRIKQTGDDGRFEIPVQNILDPTRRFQSFFIWAHRAGYDIRCVNPSASGSNDLKLVLGKSTSIPFQFKHPESEPFESTHATPYGFALPNGRYTADKNTGLSGPLPKTIRRLLARSVSNDGSVAISGVPKLLLKSIEVSSASIGNQIVRPDGQPDLVSCGSLVGKIDCPAEELPPEVAISVTIRSMEHTIANYRFTSKDGSFSFPTIPAGRVDLQLSWPESSSLMPTPPRSVDVIAKQETLINIPVERIVKVRGRVVLSDTGDPVKEGMLSIRSRKHANVSRRALTDKDGWYETKMPSGDTTVQLFAMRHTSTHQYPGTVPMVIPEDVKQFQFDPIEVDPKNVIQGILIDKRGKKVANRHVIVYSERFGHLQGMGKTDDDGRFQLKLNNWNANQLREALQRKEKQGDTRSRRWELKVLPPTKNTGLSLKDHIAAIKLFPEIKVQSFSPVVIQIISD